MSGDLGAFLVVAAIVVITPGVDMAVVTRNALMDGRRAALLSALGINLGVLFWVMAAALGLAAIVAASATAFAAIKLAGAIYLIYLGLLALRRAPFRQGLLSNLLNPKIAVVLIGLGARLAFERR